MEVVFFDIIKGRIHKINYLSNSTDKAYERVSSSIYLTIPKSLCVDILVFKTIIRVKEISNVVEKDSLWLTLYLKLGWERV